MVNPCWTARIGRCPAAGTPALSSLAGIAVVVDPPRSARLTVLPKGWYWVLRLRLGGGQSHCFRQKNGLLYAGIR